LISLLATVIGACLAALKVTNYAMYIVGYGAPVGMRLVLEHPEQVKAQFTWNGNAYKEGLGQDSRATVFNL